MVLHPDIGQRVQIFLRLAVLLFGQARLDRVQDLQLLAVVLVNPPPPGAISEVVSSDSLKITHPSLPDCIPQVTGSWSAGLSFAKLAAPHDATTSAITTLACTIRFKIRILLSSLHSPRLYPQFVSPYQERKLQARATPSSKLQAPGSKLQAPGSQLPARLPASGTLFMAPQ